MDNLSRRKILTEQNNLRSHILACYAQHGCDNIHLKDVLSFSYHLLQRHCIDTTRRISKLTYTKQSFWMPLLWIYLSSRFDFDIRCCFFFFYKNRTKTAVTKKIISEDYCWKQLLLSSCLYLVPVIFYFQVILKACPRRI